MGSPAERVERRHKIARGSVRNIRRVIATLVSLLAGYFVIAALLLPSLSHSKGIYLASLPGGLVLMTVLFLVYLNLPGRLKIGAEGLLIDWRDERRYVAFSEISDIRVYTEKSAGKTFIGVVLALESEEVKVPIGENQFGADKK